MIYIYLNILYLMVSICVFIVGFYLFFELRKWDKAFQKWKDQSKNNDERVLEESLKLYPDAISLPEEKIVPLKFGIEGEPVQISSLLVDNMVLVFLDKKCAFCNSNFEEFVVLLESSNNKQQEIIIIFERSQIDAAIKFSSIHELNLSVYLTENTDLRKSFNVSFLPMYVQTQNLGIQNVTSSPFEIII